ncbi:hypothetical protein NDU88_004682 [Pleurodeles waltl]|uniref:Uncharacterized protein n=1 Tax=Pleurodeles waltl TaxID=8319 RepID=A0AAV7QCP9_PLEWA|nr:hypothetical protein NDU88_004682 [Pleurodeles waltl]
MGWQRKHCSAPVDAPGELCPRRRAARGGAGDEGTEQPPLPGAAAAARTRPALSREGNGRAPGSLGPQLASPGSTQRLRSGGRPSSRRGRPALAGPGCAALEDDRERWVPTRDARGPPRCPRGEGHWPPLHGHWKALDPAPTEAPLTGRRE